VQRFFERRDGVGRGARFQPGGVQFDIELGAGGFLFLDLGGESRRIGLRDGGIEGIRGGRVILDSGCCAQPGPGNSDWGPPYEVIGHDSMRHILCGKFGHVAGNAIHRGGVLRRLRRMALRADAVVMQSGLFAVRDVMRVMTGGAGHGFAFEETLRLAQAIGGMRNLEIVFVPAAFRIIEKIMKLPSGSAGL
jgi:hypothetical protein